MLMKGLYTVVITPLTPSGDLDEDGFKRNLRFQLGKVDGIVVLGTTGEAPTLTAKEQETLIRIAREEVKGKAPLVVGTGSNSTRQTVENTAKAKELGADIALVVTPYYNKPTQEGIFLHFKEISNVGLPFCVYNIQGRTGQNIQTDTLQRIADLPHAIGVKESSGSISQMSDVIETIGRHRPDFSVMCGDDALTLPLIALGGLGVLSVVSNLVPKPVSDLVKAALRGDFVKAQEIHYELMPIFRAAFIETNPGPIKAAMAMCGMAAGPCRLPLCAPLPENLAKLKQVIDTFPKEWLQPW
jgi:4-hydroxy-tetrahydrodipicolinate synthase